MNVYKNIKCKKSMLVIGIILFVVFTSILILKNIKMKNINNLNKNEE